MVYERTSSHATFSSPSFMMQEHAALLRASPGIKMPITRALITEQGPNEAARGAEN